LARYVEGGEDGIQGDYRRPVEIHKAPFALSSERGKEWGKEWGKEDKSESKKANDI